MFSMKKSLILLITGFLTFSAGGLPAATALRGLKVGDLAPEFRTRAIDGKEISRNNLKGKILLLAFWKRDQEYSEKTLADLDRIYQGYRDRGVIVLAVNVDKAPESDIRRIGTAQKLSYPLSSDPELDLYGRFGIMVIPTTVVIGPEGNLTSYCSIHSRDFYSQIRGEVRILLGEITRAQLEEELNPRKIQEVSAARKKANLHLTMGRMLMNSKMTDKAREQFEKAIQADPSLPEPHILLARLYLEEKEINKALAELDQALKLNPSSEEAKELMGIAKAQSSQ
jgi:peroxiredoxin/predicted negative regulator of RcsB-dependent stress response